MSIRDTLRSIRQVVRDARAEAQAEARAPYEIAAAARAAEHAQRYAELEARRSDLELNYLHEPLMNEVERLGRELNAVNAEMSTTWEAVQREREASGGRAANAAMLRWNVHVKNEAGRDDNVEVEAANERDAESIAYDQHGSAVAVIGAYPVDGEALGERWHARPEHTRRASEVMEAAIAERLGVEFTDPVTAGEWLAQGRTVDTAQAVVSGDEVRTYHQVTTPDGNKVITRMGVDYAIANYGLNGAVREVKGYETPRGFAYADSTVGADIRREGVDQAAAAGGSFWWGGYLFDSRTGAPLPFSENDERGPAKDEPSRDDNVAERQPAAAVTSQEAYRDTIKRLERVSSELSGYWGGAWPENHSERCDDAGWAR